MDTRFGNDKERSSNSEEIVSVPKPVNKVESEGGWVKKSQGKELLPST